MTQAVALDPDVNSDSHSYISVRELTKIYSKPKERRSFFGNRADNTADFVAVDRISFDVNPGEIFVIMGLSGSGKSTIIRMLNRLVHITDGSVVVNGKDVGSLNALELRNYRNSTVNMVFQHFGLFPHKSLIENVAFGLKVRGVSEKERLERAAENLRLVGLGDRLYALPEQLSGGQQQRVGLARALATNAEILLMDEPFSALDPLIRKEMQELLVQLQRDLNKTIIFVTHDLNEAMHLGDQVLVMKQGKMAQLAKPIDLLENPANEYIQEFTAEVDRSRVVTAGMLALPVLLGAGTGRTSNLISQRVRPDLKLHDLLPVFAEGTEVVEVYCAQTDASLGTITLQRALDALKPKGLDHGV